eukprot:248609_1
MGGCLSLDSADGGGTSTVFHVASDVATHHGTHRAETPVSRAAKARSRRYSESESWLKAVDGSVRSSMSMSAPNLFDLVRQPGESADKHPFATFLQDFITFKLTHEDKATDEMEPIWGSINALFDKGLIPEIEPSIKTLKEDDKWKNPHDKAWNEIEGDCIRKVVIRIKNDETFKGTETYRKLMEFVKNDDLLKAQFASCGVSAHSLYYNRWESFDDDNDDSEMHEHEESHKYASYGSLFDDYDYAPLSQWKGNHDADLPVRHSMIWDSQSNNSDGAHREMALGVIGLLVITCCLFACCVIVWSAFLYVFTKSNGNKRRSKIRSFHGRYNALWCIIRPRRIHVS